MKRAILIFIFIFYTNFALSAVEAKFLFSKDEITQGSIQNIEMVFDGEFYQKISLSSLKNKSFNNLIHFLDVSIPLKSSKETTFNARVSVVFIGVPQKNEVVTKIGNEEVVFRWVNLKIIPLEPSENFLFGNFEIPKVLDWFKYLAFVVGIFLIGLLCFILLKKWKRKKEISLALKKMKGELMTAKDYEAVVELWRKKNIYLEKFPQVESLIKELEITLFKYQFKSSQTENEKAEVMKAYASFCEKVKGVLVGI